ncbi:major facilitator superfamily domain-containing protein [Pyrenochaeta sp. MPI-SDFR-AT-0127]|nr:major facilitator superfamily domain-containing protein [Pyrenochaeta sp. MPI-SDFR-AT-0127]
MSTTKEKHSVLDDLEKVQTYDQLGDVFVISEPLTVEEDRRILRKIDMHLLPIMAISYLFQFLDKAALGYTAIMGLKTDLALSGSQYSWASGIYYFGYLIASYPAGILMVRYPVGKTITTSVLIWGAVLMLTAVCFNAQGLLANRFFLGFAEACIGPGLTVIVAMWYKRSEQPLRMGAWFMGNVVAGFLGGLVAYGVGHVESIAPWKAVFLVFGALTVAWSAAIFFLLPDTQANARFLSKEDRPKAVNRVRENMTGIKNNTWKPSQSLEALLDIKVWLLVIIQIAMQVANGGLQGFSSIIIKGFGFATLNTLLVQMISTAFQAVFVIVSTVGSTYFTNMRTYFMAGNLAISLIGVVMIRQLDATHVWPKFIGFCLSIAYTANIPLTLSMSSGNIGGFTKKSTVNAMIFIAYCTGNIIGPQLFFDKEAPKYSSAFLSMMVCFAIAFILCFVLRIFLVWENKRRDRATGALESQSEADSSQMNMADKTDKEMSAFRYVY